MATAWSWDDDIQQLDIRVREGVYGGDDSTVNLSLEDAEKLLAFLRETIPQQKEIKKAYKLREIGRLKKEIEALESTIVSPECTGAEE